MREEKLRIGKVFTFAGAIIAFTIGSGFATGQEISQYFVPYGHKAVLVVAVFCAIFIYTNYHFTKAGADNKFQRGSQVFSYFCGKVVGKLFDYFAVLFCYLSFVVMSAGASATLRQQYGLAPIAGGLVLTVAAAATVIFGLKAMIDVLGLIGPVIIVICIAIGVATLARDGGSIPVAEAMVTSGQVPVMKASANWFLSGCSYAGFCLLWFAGFMTELGARNRFRELVAGMVVGTVAVAAAILVISYGLLSNIQDVSMTQIPNLILAGKIFPAVSAAFAAIIFMGIYTTSVPLLWTAVSRFSQEGTFTFRVLTLILAAAGLFVSLVVPFSKLVNVIYVLNGYVGALLMVFMVIKNVQQHKAAKAAKAAQGSQGSQGGPGSPASQSSPGSPASQSSPASPASQGSQGSSGCLGDEGIV